MLFNLAVVHPLSWVHSLAGLQLGSGLCFCPWSLGEVPSIRGFEALVQSAFSAQSCEPERKRRVQGSCGDETTTEC